MLKFIVHHKRNEPLHNHLFYYLQKLDYKNENFPVYEVLHMWQINGRIWKIQMLKNSHNI